MTRTNPHGKTRLLGPGGQPAPEQPQPPDARETPFAAEAIYTPRQKAKPWKPGIPLGHGRHSEKQIALWRREAMRRRNAWTERDERQHQERYGDE